LKLLLSKQAPINVEGTYVSFRINFDIDQLLHLRLAAIDKITRCPNAA
jgi:hypothetical protein